MPICERTIESKHAAVATNLGGKRRKRSPVTVSLFSGRLREIGLRIDGTQGFLDKLLEHLGSVRNAKQQAQVFGLFEHPIVQEVLSESRPHSTRFAAKVRAILYHCDSQQQYMDITEVSKDLLARQRLKARHEKELQGLGNREAEADLGGLPWQKLLLEHVMKAKQKGIAWTFSFPAEAAKLTSLPQLLSCPVGEALPSLVLSGPSSRIMQTSQTSMENEENWFASFDTPEDMQAPHASSTRTLKTHHWRFCVFY